MMRDDEPAAIGQARKAFTLSSISHSRLTSFLEMPLRLTFVQALRVVSGFLRHRGT
jgi:hypothetical protein